MKLHKKNENDLPYILSTSMSFLLLLLKNFLHTQEKNTKKFINYSLNTLEKKVVSQKNNVLHLQISVNDPM